MSWLATFFCKEYQRLIFTLSEPLLMIGFSQTSLKHSIKHEYCFWMVLHRFRYSHCSSMLTLFVFVNLAVLVKGFVARSSARASWQHLNVAHSQSVLEQLPSTGLGMSRIDAGNLSFTYAFIAHDEDSYQVKDPMISRSHICSRVLENDL